MGNSIIRKVDKIVNRGDDIKVCLPGAKMEDIAEKAGQVMGGGTGGAGYENVDIYFFSLKKDNRTRGHKVTLVKDQCRLDIRKYSFSQRTFNEWSKLSIDCVTASCVNMFICKVLTHISGGRITHRLKMLDSR